MNTTAFGNSKNLNAFIALRPPVASVGLVLATMLLSACDSESVSVGASADQILPDNTVVGSWTAQATTGCEMVAKFSSTDTFSVLTPDSIIEGTYLIDEIVGESGEMLMSMKIVSMTDDAGCASQSFAQAAGDIVFSVDFVDLDVMNLRGFAPHMGDELTWVKDSFRGINRGDLPNS